MPTRVSPYRVLESGDAYKSFIADRARYEDALIDKWMWLLEGTSQQELSPIEESMYGSLAMLLENQQYQSHGRALEATLTTDVTLPQKYALPIVRMVFPHLLVNKIAAVQPLPIVSGGVGRIFYEDFQREDESDQSISTPDCDYSLSSENAVPKRLKYVITSDTVTAIKHILGASWSTEVQEDARGALGVDVEGALVNQMAQEILRAIDQVALAEMLVGAGSGNTNWHWTKGSGYTTNKSWYQTLGDALIDAEDNIYGNRQRHADWVVGGRRFVKFIRKMQTFQPAPRPKPGALPFRMGVEHVGTVDGFWDIYLTSYMNTDRALMGYYPTSQLDTGYIYAPYIPLAPMPLVYAEFASATDATMPGAYKNVDKFSRNVRTRFAKKMVVANAYSTLSISA